MWVLKKQESSSRFEFRSYVVSSLFDIRLGCVLKYSIEGASFHGLENKLIGSTYYNRL